MKRGFVPAAAIGVSGCAARKQIAPLASEAGDSVQQSGARGRCGEDARDRLLLSRGPGGLPSPRSRRARRHSPGRQDVVTGEARGARRLPGPFSFPSWPTRRREATVETISAAADRTPRRRATVEETA